MTRPGCALLLALACSPGAPPAEQEAGVWPPFTVRGSWGPRASLTYRIDGAGGPVPESTFAGVVREAARAWNEVSALQLVESASAESEVRFAWGRAADDADPSGTFGRDTSVAHTSAIGPGCEVLFDPSRTWRVSSEPDSAPADSPSLYQAAVHETGHALGLGHCPDPRALLYPQRENGVERPMPPDRAGIEALYGGSQAREGTLRVTRAGGSVLALPGVAPSGTDWDAFDTDGDGDAELVVWDSSGAHQGAWMVYDFERGPHLAGTRGPHLGAALPGGALVLQRTGDELRLLSEDPRSRAWTRRAFDAAGFLGAARPHVGEVSGVALGGHASREVDLDGDGAAELLSR